MALALIYLQKLIAEAERQAMLLLHCSNRRWQSSRNASRLTFADLRRAQFAGAARRNKTHRCCLSAGDNEMSPAFPIRAAAAWPGKWTSQSAR